jgi:hypothetical protein
MKHVRHKLEESYYFSSFQESEDDYGASAVAPRWSGGNKRRETFKSDRSLIQDMTSPDVVPGNVFQAVSSFQSWISNLTTQEQPN